MELSSILKTVSTVLLVVTSICYAYQVLYLFLPLILKKRPGRSDDLHKYAILIPARNEEQVLPHLLRSIHAQDYPQELLSVYVVADNCTDGTADVAQKHGAKVFTRFNTQQVGKGYALSYLLEQIDQTDSLDSFDAFLVFDADNLLQTDYIRQINRICADGFEAFCGFRNTKNFGSSWVSAGYGVWYLHDSTHLNRSRMLLGTSCAVNGTGFGFTRQLLKKCGQWDFFTLTEDIEFSTWCASHGVKVGYCHDAVLFDEQPLTFAQSWRQRTRWVQGGIQIFFKRSGELFRGMTKGGWQTYACLETATLSMWGYMLAGLSGVTAAVATLVSSGVSGLLFTVLGGAVGGYMSMLAMGALTVAMEWKQIRAKPKHKLLGVFAFPVFMLTFLPIAVTAPFRKFHWAPIAHTVAVSAEQLQEPNGTGVPR